MRRHIAAGFFSLLLLLCVSICASPATVTSGSLIDASTGEPANGWMGLITSTTLNSYPAGASVWPDLLVECDADGTYSFSIDETNPAYHQFYVFTLSPTHFNQILDAGHGTYALPWPEDFYNPGVVTLDGRRNNSGVDFILHSNKSNERVLMRDGVTRLSTDIYRARPSGKGPTVLTRTVYDKNNSVAMALYTLFGYNIVLQDSRGRYDSDGVDAVFRSDAWGENQDGYDTVEWIAAQPFSNGKIGMYGGSALGITQYLTAAAAPPHLTCCYAVAGTGDLYSDLFFTGGIFRTNMIEGWLEGQGSLHFMDDVESHPNRDSWWDDVDISTRLDQITVPFLHAGGWFDILLQGTTRGFHNLQRHGGDGARGTQKLLIGPWDHSNFFSAEQGELTFPDNAATDGEYSNWLVWFDYWLKGIDNGFSERSPVRYYVMGDVDNPAAPGNQWRDAKFWPPLCTPVPYFLWADGTLRKESPERAREASVPFSYDPADPVPTRGGANLILPSGPYDQRPLEARDDVITFTTRPLSQPLEVTGLLSATLYVSSQSPDTDFMVKLCDVYPDGRSMLIQEGAIHGRHRVDDRSENLLEPGAVYAIDVNLWSTSIVFNKGHRIRLSVTSSNDPRWETNPNTGEPFRQHTHTRVAVNRVHCKADLPSRIVLPVVPTTP